MGSGKAKPICLSIILCDEVYRDQTTQKQVIVGTFRRINTPKLPCLHRKMVVLFTLTDCNGEFDLKLVIEHEKSGQRVMELGGPLVMDDPLAVQDFDVVIHGLVLPNEGKYWLNLEVDGVPIQQSPFFVRLNTPPSEGPHDAPNQ